MGRPTRIVIAGAATGARWNAGDEAILQAMLDEIREVLPDPVIDVLSANPPGSLQRFDVHEIRYDDIGSIVTATRAADLLLIGGGGLFFDYWDFPVKEVLTPEHNGLSFYTGIALLATLFRTPLMMYGVGVGPLITDEGRRFTRLAFEQADAITVRDDASARLLTLIGIAPERISITADPVFASRFEIGPENGALESPVVVIAARPWTLNVSSEWAVEAAGGLDAFLRKHGGSVVFVPFHKTVGDVSDIAIAREIYQAMSLRSRAIVLGEDLTVTQIASVIAHSDLVVGMRLHSIIFAILQRVPFVAISYDPKVENTVPTSFAQCLVPLSTLTATTLATALDAVWRDRDSLHNALESVRASRAKAAATNPAMALATISAVKRAPDSETLEFAFDVAARQLLRVADLEHTTARLQREGIERQEAIDWLREELRIRDERLAALNRTDPA